MPMSATIKVFDGMVFGQAEDVVLRLRIDTTCASVDHIIVSEGTTSLAGTRQQPFVSPARRAELQQRCPGKVHFVVTETYVEHAKVGGGVSPALEMQMNAIVTKAVELGLAPRDVVALTEHDEIPSPTLLNELRARGGFPIDAGPRVVGLRTQWYYYCACRRRRTSWCVGAVCMMGRGL